MTILCATYFCVITAGSKSTPRQLSEISVVVTMQIDHLIYARWPDLDIVKKQNKNQQKRKNRTSKVVAVTVLVDHKLKTKGNEERDKYVYLTRELKKLRNMKVSAIPIVIGTLDIGWIKRMEDMEIRERAETIQITALLRSAGIQGCVLVT